MAITRGLVQQASSERYPFATLQAIVTELAGEYFTADSDEYVGAQLEVFSALASRPNEVLETLADDQVEDWLYGQVVWGGLVSRHLNDVWKKSPAEAFAQAIEGIHG